MTYRRLQVGRILASQSESSFDYMWEGNGIQGADGITAKAKKCNLVVKMRKKCRQTTITSPSSSSLSSVIELSRAGQIRVEQSSTIK